MKYCHPGDVLVMLMSSSGGLFHVDGRLETGDIIVTINYAETARMTLADIRLLYLLISDLMGGWGGGGTMPIYSSIFGQMGMVLKHEL